MIRTISDGSPGLRLSAWIERGHVIAALGGELDIASAPALREQLLGLLRPAASRLVIDLSAVRYADASGLAVLVGTARRAKLLGGFLRLAAPTPAVAGALRLSGVHRQLDTFRTVQAAIIGPPASLGRPGASTILAVGAPQARSAPGAVAARQPADAGELRLAVGAVLWHAEAWRDADPRRQFTPVLQALSRAYSGASHVALTEAAQALLLVLARRPLTPSPAVAATASRLHRLLHSVPAPPAN